MNLENVVDNLATRYAIVTAQYNAKVNTDFMETLDKYCEVNDAEIMVLPTTGKTVSEDPVLDDKLTSNPNVNVIKKDYMLNNNVQIKDFGVRPQQINPLTGLDRFAQGDKSYIMPGTKQTLKYIANSHNEIPKAIMTTGAITHPRYNNRHRIGRIAHADHTYGFVVAEVENDEFFHFRHVRARKNGKFTDNGYFYHGSFKPMKIDAKAIIPGDIHPYDTNEIHKQATFEQMKAFNVEDTFLHDVFNGISISHHYKNDNKRYYEAYLRQGLNLEDELKYTAEVINEYAKHSKGNVIIVPSNHNEHLERYLSEGRFIRDKGNDKIAAQLYAKMLEGKDPLYEGLNMVSKLRGNIKFPDLDDDIKYFGYQLNHHGHKGLNGGRGSIRSAEIGAGKSVSGHGHSPYIIRNTYRVGTSTNLKLDYTKGQYSNWNNTNGVMYRDGTIQLFNTINGRWRASKNSD